MSDVAVQIDGKWQTGVIAGTYRYTNRLMAPSIVEVQIQRRGKTVDWGVEGIAWGNQALIRSSAGNGLGVPYIPPHPDIRNPDSSFLGLVTDPLQTAVSNFRGKVIHVKQYGRTEGNEIVQDFEVKFSGNYYDLQNTLLPATVTVPGYRSARNKCIDLLAAFGTEWKPNYVYGVNFPHDMTWERGTSMTQALNEMAELLQVYWVNHGNPGSASDPPVIEFWDEDNARIGAGHYLDESVISKARMDEDAAELVNSVVISEEGGSYEIVTDPESIVQYGTHEKLVTYDALVTGKQTARAAGLAYLYSHARPARTLTIEVNNPFRRRGSVPGFVQRLDFPALGIVMPAKATFPAHVRPSFDMFPWPSSVPGISTLHRVSAPVAVGDRYVQFASGPQVFIGDRFSLDPGGIPHEIIGLWTDPAGTARPDWGNGNAAFVAQVTPPMNTAYRGARRVMKIFGQRPWILTECDTWDLPAAGPSQRNHRLKYQQRINQDPLKWIRRPYRVIKRQKRTELG